MSNNFIGSKIAIITKTQCRYIGTIIGIDPETSSILLGTVTCFGTENRPGNFLTNQIAGTIVPLMQFANSDIEDLKIVDDEYIANELAQKQTQRPIAAASVPAPAPVFPQASIHDDPAIVSAVVSSSNQDQRANSSLSTQLINAFDQMNLTNENSKKDGFVLSSDPVEIQSSWPTVVGASKVETNDKNKLKSTNELTQNNKSRFFDQFTSKSNETFQSSRDQNYQSNNYSNQANRSNHFHSQNQGFRSSNGGNQQNSSRNFYNNHHRSGHVQQNLNRRPNGNRETFQTNVREINDDFDFESSNRSFHKITSDQDEEQEKLVQTSQNKLVHHEQATSSQDFQPIYDKKKSFFDTAAISNAAEPNRSNRSLNTETFGSDGFSRRSKNRPQNYNQRRPNNNQYRQHHQAYDDYFHRPLNNGNENSFRH